MEPVFLVFNRIGTLRRMTVHILKNLKHETIYDSGSIQDTLMAAKKLSKNTVVILELSAGLSMMEELDFVKKMAFKIPIIVTIPVVDHQYILQFHDAGARKILLKTHDFDKFSNNLNKTLEEFNYAEVSA